MIYEPDVPRESGEPRSEHAVREAREQRKAHVTRINNALNKARYDIRDPLLLDVVELLVEFVDDLCERTFL